MWSCYPYNRKAPGRFGSIFSAEMVEQQSWTSLLLALPGNDLVSYAASVDWKSLVVANALEFGNVLRISFDSQQLINLAVAVLFDHIDPLVAANKIQDLLGERKCANAAIADRQAVFLPQLVERFHNGPVGRSVGDNANLCPVRFLKQWTGDPLARRFELFR